MRWRKAERSPADATLAARMLRRDAAAFVGRAPELQIVSEAFADDSPISVLLVHGPAGIGKSAFLREVERRGRHAGWIAFTTAREQRLEEAQNVERPLVLIDDWERTGTTGHRLRGQLLPALPARAIVALASRQPPEPEWFEGGWDTLVFEVALGPLVARFAGPARETGRCPRSPGGGHRQVGRGSARSRSGWRPTQLGPTPTGHQSRPLRSRRISLARCERRCAAWACPTRSRRARSPAGRGSRSARRRSER